MSDEAGAARSRQWPKLIAAFIIAGVASLSIHVVMLQVFWVPFPEDQAPTWAKLLNLTGTTSALIIFQVAARDKLGGFLRTVAASGLILLFLKEGIRGAVMNGVVTTGWAFALAGLLIPILLCLGIALFCAIAARWVTSVTRLVAAGFVTGLLAFAWQILVGAITAPVMIALSDLARPDVFQLPYPTEVLIPAYLTFAEPLIGCALIAALIWDRLDGSLTSRLLQFTLLVVFLKGVILRTLIFPLYMKPSYFEGMLSQSQFLLEFAALAILVASAWHWFGSSEIRTGRSEV